MVRRLFNVDNIKYRFLSDSGHSIRFLNKLRKSIQSSNRISEKFFITSCKLGRCIQLSYFAYHLGPCPFMANKNFVKEVRVKVEFLESSQKNFMKMKTFLTKA